MPEFSELVMICGLCLEGLIDGLMLITGEVGQGGNPQPGGTLPTYVPSGHCLASNGQIIPDGLGTQVTKGGVSVGQIGSGIRQGGLFLKQEGRQYPCCVQ